MDHKTEVLIIGGGVIGAACAYYLSQRGASVTVIDKGAIGHGCSYGNAGWIVPCHAMPLPMPGALRHALRWMLTPDSPLYIKPRWSWDMARWLIRFLSCANERHLRYAAPLLVGLAQQSLRLTEQFIADHGPCDMGFQKRGLIYACQSRSGLDDARHEMNVAQSLGVPGRELSADGLRELEPSITGPVLGGIYFSNQAHVEPLKFVQALAQQAATRGATFLPQTEVYRFDCSARRIEAVQTTRGRFVAEQIILATGSWTPPLARQLRLRVPIQAGKGYAVIVEPFAPTPKIPIVLIEKRVAVTPREGSVRLAGTMELAGLNESITPRRVDAIIRGGRELLNLPERFEIIETWRGLRPCTPDGIPMIGRVESWDNLLLATGHAMLGLTLAAGTGQLVADLCTGKTPAVDARPFLPSRFC